MRPACVGFARSIANFKNLSNAQQSCVPATALKRKVTKLQFCLSVSLPVLSICLSVHCVFQKSIQKSIQHPSKSSPKCSKIEVWRELGAALRRVFAPRRLWVASWTALGQLLGGSWRILGASWVAPGLSWAPGWGAQGRLEGSLEASWEKFHPEMEPSWH